LKDLKAIIFDYDGVISESLDLKTRAFEAMYAPYGEEIAAKVTDHHQRHGGVSRYEKFRLYHRDLLGEEIDEQKVLELADRFSELVLEQVVRADFVPGVIDFIKNNENRYHFYISTGTPEDEILEVTGRRNIRRFFDGIYGSPAKKTDHIRKIMKEGGFSNNELIFIGDAPTDRDAARVFDITFIGRYTTAEEIRQEKYLIRDFRNFEEFLMEI
jgi:phosphoglycolate phosphatase-like HAD superfamily hydrolase